MSPEVVRFVVLILALKKLRRVVFPEPEGPNMAVEVPFSKSPDIPFRIILFTVSTILDNHKGHTFGEDLARLDSSPNIQVSERDRHLFSWLHLGFNFLKIRGGSVCGGGLPY